MNRRGESSVVKGSAAVGACRVCVCGVRSHAFMIFLSSRTFMSNKTQSLGFLIHPRGGRNFQPWLHFKRAQKWKFRLTTSLPGKQGAFRL